MQVKKNTGLLRSFKAEVAARYPNVNKTCQWRASYETWTETSVHTVQECTQEPHSVISCLKKTLKCYTKNICCDVYILRYVSPNNEVTHWSVVLSWRQSVLFAVVQTQSAHARAQLWSHYHGIHTRHTPRHALNFQYQCSNSRACTDPRECDLLDHGRRHSEEISLINMLKKLYIDTFLSVFVQNM
jgi:hypothetical protein